MSTYISKITNRKGGKEGMICLTWWPIDDKYQQEFTLLSWLYVTTQSCDMSATCLTGPTSQQKHTPAWSHITFARISTHKRNITPYHRNKVPSLISFLHSDASHVTDHVTCAQHASQVKYFQQLQLRFTCLSNRGLLSRELISCSTSASFK